MIKHRSHAVVSYPKCLHSCRVSCICSSYEVSVVDVSSPKQSLTKKIMVANDKFRADEVEAYLKSMRYSVTQLNGCATLCSCCLLYLEPMFVSTCGKYSRPSSLDELPPVSSISQQGRVQVTNMRV